MKDPRSTIALLCAVTLCAGFLLLLWRGEFEHSMMIAGLLVPGVAQFVKLPKETETP